MLYVSLGNSSGSMGSFFPFPLFEGAIPFTTLPSAYNPRFSRHYEVVSSQKPFHADVAEALDV